MVDTLAKDALHLLSPEELTTYQQAVAELQEAVLFQFFFFLLWRCDPTRVMASFLRFFLDHTQRRTTVGRTPLDE